MPKSAINRRQLLTSTTAASVGALVACGSGSLTQTVKASEACGTLTPAQPEGPFYPEASDWLDDQDLTSLLPGDQPAKGDVIHLRGTVTNTACQPLAAAIIEIWQADFQGVYNHSLDPRNQQLTPDPDFQFWARAKTDSQGRFGFKTIKPGAYPAGREWIRPSHIHIKVMAADHLPLTTQIYFAPEQTDTYDENVLATVTGLSQAYRDHGGSYVTRFLHQRDGLLKQIPAGRRQQLILERQASGYLFQVALQPFSA